MKAKIFSLILLIALLSLGMVSATVTFLDSNNDTISSVSASAVQGSQASVTFKVQADNTNGDFTTMGFTSPIILTGTSDSFSPTIIVTPIITTILQGNKSELITLTFNVPLSQAVGTYIGNINLTGTYAIAGPYNLPITLTVTAALLVPEEIISCSTLPNPNNDLKVKISDVKVLNGFGDDNEWLPFDEIEIEIEIENDNNNDKIENIVVGWGLYDSTTDTWYIDDEENDFNLKKKTDKVITLAIKIDDDIDELEDGDYTLYVWANAETEDGDEICEYDSEDISLEIEDDFVILDDIKIVETAQCNMELQIVADVWNIGSDDQDDVYVMISNSALGINKKVEIGDINSFDNEKLNTNILIPKDAKEMTYYLDLRVYDEDNDVYETDFDEDSALFTKQIKVEGNCQVAPKATITAALNSEAKAGKELVVKATIVNTGDKEATYTMRASDYESWASFKDIKPAVVVLAAGESAEVIYKLTVNKDALGSQTFNIELKTGESEKETLKQPVSVTIEESTGFKFPSFTGAAIGGDNWYLWGIGLLNVILIIIIIIVAIRVAKS